MRVAATITLTQEHSDQLRTLVTGRRVQVRVAERARIVLLAAEGRQDKEIAALLGITRQKSARWRARFIRLGISGLAKDAPRSGTKRRLSPDVVREAVRLTTQELPSNATHWSTPSLSRVMKISASSIGRIWRAHGLKPHLVKTFKVSNDKNFAEKLEDIVGLYLSPPEHALVFCCDEKSQIQALDRTQPGLPIKKGRCGTMTHDYKRNGTTTLFAALNTQDGTVIGTCMKQNRHQEWLKFLRLIDKRTCPEKELHLIADNYATHKHPAVQRWLKRHPRFHMHFTPTSASWLNMVERFFRDITQNRLKRDCFESVDQLIAAIDNYLEIHNREPKPFIWTAKAADILEKVKRARSRLDKLQTA
jgi:transposase